MRQIFGSNKKLNNKQNEENDKITSTTNDEIRKLALESIKLIKRDRIVIETKKFAGQSIQ